MIHVQISEDLLKMVPFLYIWMLRTYLHVNFLKHCELRFVHACEFDSLGVTSDWRSWTPVLLLHRTTSPVILHYQSCSYSEYEVVLLTCIKYLGFLNIRAVTGRNLQSLLFWMLESTGWVSTSQCIFFSCSLKTSQCCFFLLVYLFNWDICCKMYVNVDVPFSLRKIFGLALFVYVERSTRRTFLYWGNKGSQYNCRISGCCVVIHSCYKIITMLTDVNCRSG